MRQRRVWPSAALVIAMVAALLTFVSAGQPALAAHPIGPAQAQPFAQAHAPTQKAKTYFSCVWKGQTIVVKHLANAPVERYKDSVLAGQCSKFKTNDKYYSRLVGKSLNVFVAWAEYPGQFIIHNARQGQQPVYGDWSFPVGLQAPATMSGKITDAVTQAAIAGATVTAKHCVTKPVRACTSYTSVTSATGTYTLRFYVAGSYKVTVTNGGYTKSAPATVKIAFGNAMTTNVALVQSAVSTSITVTANPNPVNVNQSTTVTVSVAQPVNDGTISVTGLGPNGVALTAQMCTPVNGTCTFSWKPSTVGAWTISATWSGDSHYTQATNSVNVQVNAVTSSTTLTVSSNPIQPTPGHAAQVTATLGVAANDGSVTFTASGPGGATVTVAPCTPIAGVCTSSWTPSAAGTWTLSANWSGDTQYSSTTGSIQVPVGAGTLTVGVTATPNTPTSGQAVTATATLSQPVNDGTVTFTFAGPAGATVASQTCTPISGACKASFTPTAAGTWTITASWSGDSQYNQASGAGSISVTTNQLTLTVNSTPTQVTAGQTGTLTAIFSKAVSDGIVTFTVTGPGNPQLSTNSCTPTAGTCSVTWKPSLPGTYSVTASWSGDSQYQGATSTALSLTVSTTTLTLTASPTTLALGTAGALTATLNQQSVNDGTITFTATGPNGITIAVPTCVPTNGSCSVQWTPSTSGTWTVTANWSGDGTYPAATSTAATVTVTGSASLHPGRDANERGDGAEHDSGRHPGKRCERRNDLLHCRRSERQHGIRWAVRAHRILVSVARPPRRSI